MQERRIVTVLFADVVGFTALSERHDPEDVAAIQQAYFDAVRATLDRYGGQLEKFIGDAACAVFGVPRTREDDAIRAVRAGLALHHAVASIGAELGLEPGTLALRVGINSGEVAYTAGAGEEVGQVTGDAVNVAARLQTAAEPGAVLVGPETALAVAEAVELEPAGVLELKGKASGVRAHAVAGLRPRVSREAALGHLRAPTVGRESELAGIRDDLAVAGTGDPRKIVVVAPPGVGKSRLVDEVTRAARAGDQAVRVWRASCRGEVTGPFAPIADLLAQGLRASGVVGAPGEPGFEDQARTVLAQRLGAAGVAAANEVSTTAAALLSDAPAPGDRDSRFGAWLTTLGVLEGEATGLWVVEDVHDASADLLDFLDAAVARDGAHRLVLATARPAIRERRPGWFEPDAGHRVLDLGPLGPDELRALVDALTGGALPEHLVAEVARRSDGNPLFVEELLRTWLALGVLAEGPTGVELVAEPDRVPVPTTVRALYAAQLDDLPEDARTVAQHGSVVGHTFAVAALHALELPAVDHGLEHLRTDALVVGPVEDELGEAYAYRHALLAETAYATLSRGQRSRLHAELADWIRDLRPGVDEVADAIAYHYAAALDNAPGLGRIEGPHDRDELRELTVAWRLRAAEHALASSAIGAAERHADAVLALEPRPRERADALRLLGTAVSPTSAERGAAVLEQAVAAYEELGELPISDPQLATGYAQATSELCQIRFNQIRFDDVVGSAERALGNLADLPALEHPRVKLELRWAYGLTGRDGAAATAATAEPVVVRAQDLLGRSADPDLELDLIGLLLERGQELETLVPLLEREIVLARERGRWGLVLGAERALAALVAGDTEELVRRTEPTPAVAASFGLASAEAFAWYAVTEARMLAGTWQGAVEAGRRALELADEQHLVRAAVRTLFALAPIVASGADDELRAWLGAWVEQHRDQLVPPSPYGRVNHAAVELSLGLVTPAAFVPSVDDVAEEAVGHGAYLTSREAVVHAWLRTGRGGDAAQVLARLRDDPELDASDDLTTVLARCSVALIDGWLAVVDDDQDRAARAARSCVEGATAVAAPWWAVRGLRVLEAVGAAEPQDIERRVVTENELGVRVPVLPPQPEAPG